MRTSTVASSLPTTPSPASGSTAASSSSRTPPASASQTAGSRPPPISRSESPVELNYDDALALLRAHNSNDSLVKHGIAVGAGALAYARKYGEDELKWRIAGLLHDVDYEEHPTIEEHGLVGSRWLAELGYPDDIVHAVIAHNDYHGVPRDDLMSRVVFACDELAGLITATALVRPNKSILGLEASSVRKKMKDKA